MLVKENLLTLFKELDGLLKQDQVSISTIVIYGGASLIFQDIIDRATVDVDVFDPQLQDKFRLRVLELAQKHSLDPNWINSTGNAFKVEMPKGWQQRVDNLFTGEVLIVNSLSRVDLIFTKLLAELDRGEDLLDLNALQPTYQELDDLTPHLLSLESNPSWKQNVMKLLSLLKNGQ